MLFMVDVINCSAQTEKKTEKIKIIVKSAEKLLGIRGFGREEKNGNTKWRDSELTIATRW